MDERNRLDETKVLLKSLIISSSRRLTIQQLNRDYRTQEGQYIPYNQFGYSSLKTFLQNIPDVLTVDPYTEIVDPVLLQNSPSLHVHKLVSEQKSARHRRTCGSTSYRTLNRAPCRTQSVYKQNSTVNRSNLYQHSNQYNQRPFNPYLPTFQPGLLLARPTSLLNLPMYHQFYNTPNDRRYGPMQSSRAPPVVNSKPAYVPPADLRSLSTQSTSTVPSMPSSLNTSSSNSTSQSHQNGYDSVAEDHKTLVQTISNLHITSEPLLQNDDTKQSPKQSSKSTDALPPLDTEDPIKFIGSGFLSSKYGKNIPPAVIGDLRVGDMRRICISEITSPWKFWFLLLDAQHLLEDIQNELSSTYTDNSDDMTISISQLQIGYACVGFHLGKWLRAEIISRPTNGMCKLCFVDFGTTGEVNIKYIRYLLSDLCTYPRQCYRGTLDCIEPIDNYDIEKEATQTFCKMVLNKSLVGVITNVEKNGSVDMVVVDSTQKNKDIIINQELIENVFGK